MKKVLLINPPKHTMHKENIWKVIDTSLPSLGLAYIASYLEKRGIQVRILDMVAESYTHEDLVSIVQDFKPDFIGITATTVTIVGALSVAKICKSAYPKTKIVFGGPHASAMPEDILRNSSIDMVIRGEGEINFGLLVSGKSLSKIPGLSYRTGGKIKEFEDGFYHEGSNFYHNPRGSFIENLDELPFPAWHLLPMEKYRPSLGNYKRLPAMSVLCGRGCPGICTYCYAKSFGRKIRFRSSENIMKEMWQLVEHYGIREINFYDENFTTNRTMVKDLCRKMIKEDIDLTWVCSSRVDTVDIEMLNLMSEAGCHQIAYGIESADEQILENLKKNISLDKATKAVKMTQKVGINARANFMFGSPGETIETMEKTLQYAISLEPDFVVFNITTPLPGTEMFEWAKKNNVLRTENWGEYDFSRHVMNLPTVDSEEVMEYYKKSHKIFYGRPRYIIKKAWKIGLSYRNLKAFIDLMRG